MIVPARLPRALKVAQHNKVTPRAGSRVLDGFFPIIVCFLFLWFFFVFWGDGGGGGGGGNRTVYGHDVSHSIQPEIQINL